MTGQLKPAVSHATASEIRRDFRDSAEDLLKATADLGGERLVALRTQVDEAFRTMKMLISEAREAVIERARADGRAANAYVHENPWKTVGIAAGAGLIVGALLARR